MVRLLANIRFIGLTIILFSSFVATQADPDKFPVHIDFGSIDFDPSTNTYTQEGISKSIKLMFLV